MLKTVPVFINCSGTYDVDYKIIIAGRDGKIHQIKNGTVSSILSDLVLWSYD